MSATLQITLPEPLRDFVQEKVTSGQYMDASAYIASLIGAARQERTKEAPACHQVDEDWEPIIPDTDVPMTIGQMAAAFDQLGPPTKQEDAELTFDPDDDPPY